MMTEREVQNIYDEIDNIVDELLTYDECDEEMLQKCEEQAIAGVDNMNQLDGMVSTVIGLAEMKGEWTIRQTRAVNDTEEEFAERFISVLWEAVNGPVTND